MGWATFWAIFSQTHLVIRSATYSIGHFLKKNNYFADLKNALA
jgi:hypothetical protein